MHGKELKEARRVLRITQTQLAALAKSTPQLISHIENGCASHLAAVLAAELERRVADSVQRGQVDVEAATALAGLQALDAPKAIAA